MAKGSSSSDFNKIAGILALIAIFIAGILGLINFIAYIIEYFGGSFSLGRAGSVLSLISNIFLLIAVVMISWRALVASSLKNKKVWFIIYWIIVVCAALGVVKLGLTI